MSVNNTNLVNLQTQVSAYENEIQTILQKEQQINNQIEQYTSEAAYNEIILAVEVPNSFYFSDMNGRKINYIYIYPNMPNQMYVTASNNLLDIINKYKEIMNVETYLISFNLYEQFNQTNPTKSNNSTTFHLPMIYPDEQTMNYEIELVVSCNNMNYTWTHTHTISILTKPDLFKECIKY